MFIKNIHVSLCSINLCLENGPGKKVYLKTYLSNTPNMVDQIQIHGLKFDQIQIQIRRICICICKYKYAVFVFVFANTNTYLTPALHVTNPKIQ